MLHLYETYICDTEHYRVITKFSKAEIAQYYSKQCEDLIPMRFRRGVKWTEESIPYAYENYKLKCFSKLVACTKLHNCCRELVSWVNWPLASIFKHVARALQILVRAETKPHWELWSMANVRDELHDRISGLIHAPQFDEICFNENCKNSKFLLYECIT